MMFAMYILLEDDNVHNHWWFNVSDEQSNSPAVFNVGRVSYNYYNLHKPPGSILSAGMLS